VRSGRATGGIAGGRRLDRYRRPNPSPVPTATPTASPIPTTAPAPTPTPLTAKAAQAQLDALRKASDCDGVFALDEGVFGSVSEDVAADYQAALEDCDFDALYPTPKPGRVVVNGTGSRNSKPFALATDAYDVVIKGTGERGNVAIVLMSVNGEYVDLLVNEVSRGGSYRYETAQYDLGCSTNSGCYFLDATMPNGAWSVTFTPMK